MTSSRCRCGPFGVVPSRSHQARITRPQNRIQVVAYPCERKSQKSLASVTNHPKKSLASVTNEILSLANEIVALANEILCLANDPGFLESVKISRIFVGGAGAGAGASCRVTALFAVRYSPNTRARKHGPAPACGVFHLEYVPAQPPGATSRHNLPEGGFFTRFVSRSAGTSPSPCPSCCCSFGGPVRDCCRSRPARGDLRG